MLPLCLCSVVESSGNEDSPNRTRLGPPCGECNGTDNCDDSDDDDGGVGGGGENCR